MRATYAVSPYDGAPGIVRTIERDALPMPKVVAVTVGMFETRAGQCRPLTLHEIRDCLDAVWAQLLQEASLPPRTTT